LLLAFVVFAVCAAAAQASPQTRALDYLHAKQFSSGGFGSGSAADVQITPWAIMAISAAGEGPQKSQWTRGGKDPIDYLQGLDLEATAGSSSDVVNRPAFYAKVMLAYIAAGRLDLIWSAGAKGISLPDKLRLTRHDDRRLLAVPRPALPPTLRHGPATIWAIRHEGRRRTMGPSRPPSPGSSPGRTAAEVRQPAPRAQRRRRTAAAVMALRAPVRSQRDRASNPQSSTPSPTSGRRRRSDGSFPSMATDGAAAGVYGLGPPRPSSLGQTPSSWE
jgi:hypothetical protein